MRNHPRRPFFLFAGRLEFVKGVPHRLIELFKKHPEYDLKIAGDEPYCESLEERAANCRNIEFLGRLSQEEIGVAYRSALALIVPSICYETFGMTIVEAFSNKTPVIANDLEEVLPEIIEESGGGYVYRSDEELILAVRKLASDAPLRAELGQNGHRAFLKYWNEEPHLEQYFTLIESLRTQKKPVQESAREVGTSAIA